MNDAAQHVGRLVVSGDVDMVTVPSLLEQARSCLQDNPAVVEVDLSGVSFIDSSGLGALVRIRNDAAQQGAGLVLVGVGGATGRLLTLSGLDHVFDLRPSV